jgi:hypothetical protein
MVQMYNGTIVYRFSPDAIVLLYICSFFFLLSSDNKQTDAKRIDHQNRFRRSPDQARKCDLEVDDRGATEISGRAISAPERLWRSYPWGRLFHCRAREANLKVHLMPRKRTSPARPYGQGKKLKAFRCTEKTSRLLKRAAKKAKISEAAYIEAALEDRFRKDGLLAAAKGGLVIMEEREAS